jgi:hypothetical protein
MEMVTIFQALNPMDAQLVRARLAAAEFHPYVKDELSALSNEGGVLAAGGILVQVPSEEAEEAREFLAADNPPPSE